MMIDIDDELVLEAGQSWPIHIAALDDKGRIVSLSHVVLNYNRIRCREHIVSRGHAVAQNYIGVLAQGPQHPVERESRTQAVAIGTDVRCNHEALLLFYKLYNLTK